jgi:hypothetical protein
VPAEIQAKLEALEKASEDLKQQLEKAQQEAEAEREARQKEVYLQKARGFQAIGIDVEELSDQLLYLAKMDEERAAWWEETLKALDAQLVEAGLFSELGTAERPETTSVLEKAQALATEGKSFRDALLELDPNEAEKYLREVRKQIRLGEPA